MNWGRHSPGSSRHVPPAIPSDGSSAEGGQQPLEVVGLERDVRIQLDDHLGHLVERRTPC